MSAGLSNWNSLTCSKLAYSTAHGLRNQDHKSNFFIKNKIRYECTHLWSDFVIVGFFSFCHSPVVEYVIGNYLMIYISLFFSQ